MQQIIEMLAKSEVDRDELKAKLDSNQDRMAKFEEKMGDIMEHKLQHILSHINLSRQILSEAKKTLPEPRMMPPVEGNQDIPTKDAAVMPVGKPRTRRTVWNLAAERGVTLMWDVVYVYIETTTYCSDVQAFIVVTRYTDVFTAGRR
jgi:hypothetical protein